MPGHTSPIRPPHRGAASPAFIATLLLCASPGPVAGPDGELTADDVILFINRFTAGC